MAVAAATKGKIKNHSNFILVFGVPLLVIVIVAVALIYHNHVSESNKVAQADQERRLANKAFLKGNKAQALEHAKKALADQPNNISNIQMVANLMNSENPSAAKQYYVQVFDKYKQQNDIGSAHTTAVNYYVAARFAQQAGEISQAKQYYQDVIKTARPSNSYEQSLAKQASAELKVLQ